MSGPKNAKNHSLPNCRPQLNMYWQRILFALAVSTGISVRGYRKKSLSLDGAMMAFATGLIHCFAGYDVTFVLAFFFFSSSYFTKYKQHIKHKLEADFKEGTAKFDISWSRPTFGVFSNSDHISLFLPQVVNVTLFKCSPTVALLLLRAWLNYYWLVWINGSSILNLLDSPRS